MQFGHNPNSFCDIHRAVGHWTSECRLKKRYLNNGWIANAGYISNIGGWIPNKNYFSVSQMKPSTQYQRQNNQSRNQYYFNTATETFAITKSMFEAEKQVIPVCVRFTCQHKLSIFDHVRLLE